MRPSHRACSLAALVLCLLCWAAPDASFACEAGTCITSTWPQEAWPERTTLADVAMSFNHPSTLLNTSTRKAADTSAYFGRQWCAQPPSIIDLLILLYLQVKLKF